MPNDPAVSFYFGNYYTSTRRMKQEERGAYMDVLCMLHQNGHLTRDEIITFCEGKDYPNVFEKLKVDTDGLYYNERLEREIAKRKNSYDARVKNLAKFIEAPPLKGKGKPPSGPLTPNPEEIPEELEPMARFKPPTVNEVAAYCIERNNGIDPIHFINYYEARSWKSGKTKLTDWKKCVITWEQNEVKKLKEKGIDTGQHIGQKFVSGNIPAKFRND